MTPRSPQDGALAVFLTLTMAGSAGAQPAIPFTIRRVGQNDTLTGSVPRLVDLDQANCAFKQYP